MTLKLAERSISRPVGVTEDVFVKVGTFHFPADFVVINFDVVPRVPLILKRSFLKTGRALIDVFKGELTLRVGKKAITFNLDQTSRYSDNYNDIMANRIDVIDMACEEYSQEVLGFSDVIASGNPTPYYDPIVSTSSLTLTLITLSFQQSYTQKIRRFERDEELERRCKNKTKMVTFIKNEKQHASPCVVKGFPAQSIRSSNAIALDSLYLLVLITGTSQNRQHGLLLYLMECFWVDPSGSGWIME
nr:reverse transcriptase domain-containing protein [Tanacetum cinerariifolium]GEX42675.1 reverse transcriptase domain-containing protein [Tanacetum cinerariifolium]